MNIKISDLHQFISQILGDSNSCFGDFQHKFESIENKWKSTPWLWRNALATVYNDKNWYVSDFKNYLTRLNYKASSLDFPLEPLPVDGVFGGPGGGGPGDRAARTVAQKGGWGNSGSGGVRGFRTWFRKEISNTLALFLNSAGRS